MVSINSLSLEDGARSNSYDKSQYSIDFWKILPNFSNCDPIKNSCILFSESCTKKFLPIFLDFSKKNWEFKISRFIKKNWFWYFLLVGLSPGVCDSAVLALSQTQNQTVRNLLVSWDRDETSQHRYWFPGSLGVPKWEKMRWDQMVPNKKGLEKSWKGQNVGLFLEL